MKSGLKIIIGAVCAGIMVGAAVADEATGVIEECTLGAFKLNTDGTVRLFSLSSRTSRYEPTTWRPMQGDRITVTFSVRQDRNKTTLVVDQARLLTPGPNTLVGLDSPLTVEVVEMGRSGIKARIPSGQIVKFATGRSTQWQPAGWLPSPGQKAVVEFRTQNARFGFGISYVVDKIAKTD